MAVFKKVFKGRSPKRLKTYDTTVQGLINDQKELEDKQESTDKDYLTLFDNQTKKLNNLIKNY